MAGKRSPDNVENSETAPSGHTPDRWVNADLVELRLIGTWLNEACPIDRDSDGDRVLAAADEIQRLRVEIGYLEDIAECRGEENDLLRRRLGLPDDVKTKALRWGAWSWADGRAYPEPPCPTDDEFAAIMRSFGYEPWTADGDDS